MNALRKISFWLVAALFASGFTARAFGHDAKVLRLVGTAEIQMPGQSEFTPLDKDAMVPQGATIRTGANSQVFLQVFSGGIAAITENSTVSVEKLALEKDGDTVTSQEAMLDLKQGNIVSTLDPTKKAINHYGIRTPKGVAAARGTTYTVTVGADHYTVVTTLSGDVTITNLTTGESVAVTAGTVSVNGSGPLTRTQVSSNPTVNALVVRSVAIAAAALAQVQDNAGGDFSANESRVAGGELTTLRATVATSLPQAADAVNTAVQLGVVPAAAQPGGGTQTPPGQTQSPVTPVDVSQVSPGGG